MLRFVSDKPAAAMTILMRELENRLFASVNSQVGKAEQEYKKSCQGQLLSLLEKKTYESTKDQRDKKPEDRDGTPFLCELENYNGTIRLDKMRQRGRDPERSASKARSTSKTRSASRTSSKKSNVSRAASKNSKTSHAKISSFFWHEQG